MTPKILLALPTSSHKDYCLNDFTKMLKSLTYPNLHIYIVDNSKDKNHVLKLNSVVKNTPFP